MSIWESNSTPDKLVLPVFLDNSAKAADSAFCSAIFMAIWDLPLIAEVAFADTVVSSKAFSLTCFIIFSGAINTSCSSPCICLDKANLSLASSFIASLKARILPVTLNILPTSILTGFILLNAVPIIPNINVTLSTTSIKPSS